MPPTKRRKPASEEPETDEDAPPPPQQPRANSKAKQQQKEPLRPLDPDMPTNTVLPTPLTVPARHPDASIKLAAWNIAGLKACDKKGLKFYLDAEDPDVLLLSETKVQTDPHIAHLDARFPHAAWGGDPQKGYAGVAVLSKIKPLDVNYGLPTLPQPESSHGRMITLEFDTCYLIVVYVPNAGQGLKNMEAKKEWNEAFEKHLRELDARKPVIIGGDINCAQSEKDLRHAKPNWNKTPGYTQTEIDGLNAQLSPPADSGHQPLKDVWRLKHPDAEGQYTYYSYRFQCRQKGIGWRLDTFICSDRILDQVTSCEIRHHVFGASDHVPVVLEWKGQL